MTTINDWIAEKALLPIIYFILIAVAGTVTTVWSHEKSLVAKQIMLDSSRTAARDMLELHKIADKRLYRLEEQNAVNEVVVTNISEQLKEIKELLK